MNMIFDKPEIFYKEFPYKYWLYKAEMLHNMIETSPSEFHDGDGNLKALGGSLEEFQQMLKYELHFTYYHQAEALFELIFALEKVIGSSKYVWLEMSHYKAGDLRKFAEKIDRIANGSDELSIKEVTLNDGRIISFYEWLIFDRFGDSFDKDQHKVTVSTEKAREIIQFAAKDLAQKGEYNAFKHGMRILSLFDNFSIKDNETGKINLNLDIKNSFSYINFPKNDVQKGTKKGDVQVVLKGYNSKQDLLKIKLITLLMSSIVEIKKGKFFGKGKISHFFNIDIQKKLNELGPQVQEIILTMHSDSDSNE